MKNVHKMVTERTDGSKVVLYGVGGEVNDTISLLITPRENGAVEAVAVSMNQSLNDLEKGIENNTPYGIRKILNPYIGYHPGEKSVVPNDEILIGDLDRGTLFKDEKSLQLRIDALERAISNANAIEAAEKRVEVINVIE